MAVFKILDYLVLFGLMISSLAIGVYHAWIGRNGTNEEFLMGGRKMNVLPVAISLIASFMSPISVMGIPAEIYSKGSQIWMIILAIPVTSFVAAEIFLPIFYRLKLTSVNSYVYERFQSNTLRVVSSLSVSISLIPWMGVVLFTPSLVFMSVTNLSLSACILISGLIVTIYTSIGGIKAVIWTDVIQYILMITGVLAIIIKGTINVGGFNEVLKRSAQGGRIDFFNFDFNIYMGNNFWMVVIGTSMVYAGSYSTSQMLVQRTCTLPSIKKAKQVIYLAMPGFIISISLVCFIGFVIYANYYKCDPIMTGQINRFDEIVPYFVTEVLVTIPAAPGLFVACICSASLSTLSSGFNAIAALLWEDIFSKFLPNASPKKQVIITKLLASSVGGVCIIFAFLTNEIGTIFEASFAFYGAPIGPTFAIFLLGVFLPFVNATGALFGLLLGQSCCFLINIGAIINTYSKGTLLSSSEECDPKIFTNSTIPYISLSNISNYRIPNYEPEGYNHLFHLTHFMVPIVGFLITTITAILISLLTGGNRNRQINIDLFNNLTVKIFRLNKHGKQNDFFLHNMEPKISDNL